MAKVDHFPLIDPVPGASPGRSDRLVYPFKWSDPTIIKPTRCGDEFEYHSFAEMRRNWLFKSTTAADFDFNGNCIGWKPSANHSGFYRLAPSGDIEMVLECVMGSGASDAGIELGLIDASGNGGTGSTNANTSNLQTWGASAWVLGSNNVAAGNNLAFDGGHKWLAVRRTGTLLQVRSSNDGATWNSIGGGITVAASGMYMVIGIMHNSSNPSYVALHRLTVWPGPTFFPG